MFVVFEGVDGAGKTTQLTKCESWLIEKGYDVAQCHDPGSTALGNRIRQLLLDRGETSIDDSAEMFLFMAARAQLVTEFIRPALNRGQIVLCDRFLLSTVVYQGHAGQLDPKTIWEIGRTAIQETVPDLTLVLDVAIPTAFERIGNQRDSMESRGEDYLSKVRQGFLSEARIDTSIKIIDAGGDPQDIHAQICKHCENLLSVHRD